MSNEKKPEKPLTMTVEELKEKVERAIAESGLPSFLLEPIFGNYYLRLRQATEAQARAERARYEAETAKEKEGA